MKHFLHICTIGLLVTLSAGAVEYCNLRYSATQFKTGSSLDVVATPRGAPRHANGFRLPSNLTNGLYGSYTAEYGLEGQATVTSDFNYVFNANPKGETIGGSTQVHWRLAQANVGQQPIVYTDSVTGVKSLGFDGTDDILNWGSGSNWVGDTSFASAVWLWFDEAANLDTVWRSHRDGGSLLQGLLLGTGGTELKWWQDNGATQLNWETTSDPIATGQWVHVAVTWSIGNTPIIYVNATSQPLDSAAVGNAALRGGGGVAGIGDESGGGLPLFGRVTHMHHWDWQITALDVTNLYMGDRRTFLGF